VVSLVKEKFVALSLDGRIINYYDDAETEFLKKHVRVANGAHGTVDMVTAAGQPLGHGELHHAQGVYLKSLERALQAWNKLPESERRPGAVQLPERGPVDPKRVVAVRPPPDTLIMRVYNRQLGRTEQGECRYTAPEDYIPYLRDPQTMGKPNATSLFRQPANDFMWVPKSEWQTLMPANPQKGQRVEVPATLCERIFRFHLDPGRGLSESNSFDNVTAAAGQLHLTVEDVSPNTVRLRLDGVAQLNNPRNYLLSYQPVSVKKYTQSQIPLEYRPRLLGYLAYDPAKQVVTRFDMVALGEVRGRPVDSNLLGERVGEANLLGIAFELVTQPKPADYVSPRGLRNNGGNYDLRRYFGLPK
jgi:hypothetical protein